MSEIYGIDDKTRFLVLYFDAQMSVQEISRIIKRPIQIVRDWESKIKDSEDVIVPTTYGKTATPKKMSLKKMAIVTKRRYKTKDDSGKHTEQERMFRVDFCKSMLAEDAKLIYTSFLSGEMEMELSKPDKSKGLEGVRLNFWGAVSARGATSLEIYEKNMSGGLYRQVVTRHRSELDKLFAGEEFYFVQDSNPAHQVNEGWIVKDQRLKLIKLPSKSRDLNIIPSLRIVLKERVKNDMPTTKGELKTSLMKNWEILTKPEMLQPFFEELRRRYMECVGKEGGTLND